MRCKNSNRLGRAVIGCRPTATVFRTIFVGPGLLCMSATHRMRAQTAY
ncbi:hypothetical protein [Lysobacter gummosus]